MQTKDLSQEKIRLIRELFPNCVTESRERERERTVLSVDFDALRQELSDSIVEGPQERYQFTWPDKSKAKRLANTPTTMTLRPCREESVDFDNTKNLYIEGDNLEVLKILRETYLGKVKMIYIDPPYNTGNDFVYNDDFSMSVGDYSEVSGESDDSGNRLFLNTSSNGRFHTDWLNMIYPRLLLAKDFLSEDGVIFISIDDCEVENLKKICLEIFGENSFVATFPWRKRTAKSDVPFGISQDYEWIICFAKTGYKASIQGKERNYYETPDLPGRPWRYHDLTKQTTASERPNSFFTIVNPKNGKEYPADPNRTWCITSDTIKDYLAKQRIIFPGDYDFLRISKPVLRYFKEDDMAKDGEDYGRVAVSTKLPDEVGMSKDGTQNIMDLFKSKVFSFPKPVSLIEFLIDISTNASNDGIIMDFFSGSATTPASVININVKKEKNLSFIAIQLPEKSNNLSDADAHMDTICEIGKERIRRAGNEIMRKYPSSSVDVGFRVFKCDSSNMKDVFYSPGGVIRNTLEDYVDVIKDNRGSEDLLIQVMLELGIELSSKIEQKNMHGHTIYSVDGGYLVACFDDSIDDSTIVDISKEMSGCMYAIFRSGSSMTDEMLANIEQIFKTYSPQTKIRIL